MTVRGGAFSRLATSAFGDAFRAADEARRRQAQWLDRIGCAPLTVPSRVVHETRSATLLGYRMPERGRAAILLVPAPIKTAWIWDLAPGASVVRRCLAAGLQTYLVAWRRPDEADAALGLDEYAERALADCADAIADETAERRAFVAGHSLGGTLAAIFASLHPDRMRGLIALDAPIAFGTGALERVVALSPPASAIGAAIGNVPGSYLAWASMLADPAAFVTEPALDALATATTPLQRLHARVRRWSLDESPMARALFEDVVDALYRDDRFARRDLDVGGRRADPLAIDCPIVAVADPRSRVVPRASIDAFRTATGSNDVQMFHYTGDKGVMLQHVGVLVGPNAHRTLWPRILSWIATHATTA